MATKSKYLGLIIPKKGENISAEDIQYNWEIIDEKLALLLGIHDGKLTLTDTSLSEIQQYIDSGFYKNIIVEDGIYLQCDERDTQIGSAILDSLGYSEEDTPAGEGTVVYNNVSIVLGDTTITITEVDVSI